MSLWLCVYTAKITFILPWGRIYYRSTILLLEARPYVCFCVYSDKTHVGTLPVKAAVRLWLCVYYGKIAYVGSAAWRQGSHFHSIVLRKRREMKRRPWRHAARLNRLINWLVIRCYFLVLIAVILLVKIINLFSTCLGILQRERKPGVPHIEMKPVISRSRCSKPRRVPMKIDQVGLSSWSTARGAEKVTQMKTNCAIF
jgi:hypothetical protein